MPRRSPLRASHTAGIWLIAAGLGCGSENGAELEPSGFETVVESPGAALLSVSGTSPDDVWMAGADAGRGPMVLHWDGTSWSRLDAALRADLWWVHAAGAGTVYFAGSSATVLALSQGVFERLPTPGLRRDTIFGVWAAAEDDVYAVGSAAGRNGFIWHYDGRAFAPLPLPENLPRDEHGDVPGFYKVWGAAPADVWVVGDRGVVLRGDAHSGFRLIPSGSAERLFTVHGARGRVVMVGGSGNGFALEVEGDELVAMTPPGASLLQGVSVADSGAVWTVGLGGNVYTQPAPGAAWQGALTDTPVQSLHSVWTDPSGGVWSVGGDVLTDALDRGTAVLRRSSNGAPEVLHLDPPAPSEPICPAADVDPAPTASVARRWNEQLLAAIRRDVPRPMVHARTLFHLSVAIWDAWAAYDAVADGHVASERASAIDPAAARVEAISFAALRVLEPRFANAAGGAQSQACFAAFMRSLGYDPLDTTSEGDSPRALGNRIGRAVLDAYAGDGANEASDYADPDGTEAESPPLAVDAPGTVLDDPLRWQPLALTDAATLNGIELGSGVQRYAGAQWGGVTPFALSRPAAGAAYLDIGEPPTTLGERRIEEVVLVITRSGELGIEDGVRWDVSPGAYGNNSLGADDGRGHATNPVTGLPYEPRSVARGDFGRALAEYWANGPRSETPPGHWNVLANAVSGDARLERRLFGVGSAPVDALAWDAHLYLALNGALHDAAVAAWELKRRYSSARPITLIRYLGGLGQRSDPEGAAYHAAGLPLVTGAIEPITETSSAPGERHADLRRYVGEIALRVWPGEPGDRERRAAGVRWLRARDWVPYQPRSFVSPPYPGYVSEHAAFARAAAVVLHRFTGSEYFPGGLGGTTIEPGALTLEAGPSEPVPLEWATYYDAADQAGQSSVWSGIQLPGDDRDGRRVGARVGEGAVERARRHFDGTARP
jgi:hypothetical protein